MFHTYFEVILTSWIGIVKVSDLMAKVPTWRSAVVWKGPQKYFFVERFTVVSNGSCCRTFVVFCIDFGFKNLPRIGTL